MYRDCIDKNTLKPGDTVGIKIATRIGWGYFRYPKTVAMTIERITPARTKFIMKNGCEFKKSDSFYPLTAESQNQTYVAECAEKIGRYFNEIETLRQHDKLYTLDDERIVKISELFEQIHKEVSR